MSGEESLNPVRYVGQISEGIMSKQDTLHINNLFMYGRLRSISKYSGYSV